MNRIYILGKSRSFWVSYAGNTFHTTFPRFVEGFTCPWSSGASQQSAVSLCRGFGEVDQVITSIILCSLRLSVTSVLLQGHFAFPL